MADETEKTCAIPGCNKLVSPYWTTVVIPLDPGEEITHRETCYHHIGNGPKAPVEAALEKAAEAGKKVVCVPGHQGWQVEAWCDPLTNHICWRENLGDGPEGPRGPIRHWPEDPLPSYFDLYGWIVTAT